MSLGAGEAFFARHQASTARVAFDFLAFDRDYRQHLQCLRAARENARAVRGTITSDVWETLNSTYLESALIHPRRCRRRAGEFLEWVKYRAHLIRGVTSALCAG